MCLKDLKRKLMNGHLRKRLSIYQIFLFNFIHHRKVKILRCKTGRRFNCRVKKFNISVLIINNFYDFFINRFSAGFDPTIHLDKIGVVNQTTQLATDTQAI